MPIIVSFTALPDSDFTNVRVVQAIRDAAAPGREIEPRTEEGVSVLIQRSSGADKFDLHSFSDNHFRSIARVEPHGNDGDDTLIGAGNDTLES